MKKYELIKLIVEKAEEKNCVFYLDVPIYDFLKTEITFFNDDGKIAQFYLKDCSCWSLKRLLVCLNFNSSVSDWLSDLGFIYFKTFWIKLYYKD